MTEKTMGVYAIRNRNTGKCYVGASTWIEQRLVQHRAMMRDGCHPNPRLRGAVEASGLDRFEFKVVDVVFDEANLATRELSWIRRLDAVENGYNQTYRTEHFQGTEPLRPAPAHVTKSSLTWLQRIAIGAAGVAALLIFGF